MERYSDVLKTVELFKGIEETDLLALLSCLSAKLARFEKNRIVFMNGESTNSFGVVLSGQVQVYQEDYYGNKSIFANIGAGHLFGESFACAEIKTLPVSVLTMTGSDILFIDCRRLTTPCSNACAFHTQLVRNMLNIIARSNVSLTRKIEFTSKRTTREKLLSYLSSEAQRAGSGSFSIPFNRQELADFLAVDRSGLSAELGRLRDEGVLTFHKNKFELL